MSYCTYLTVHRGSGFFYIGKGVTDRVVSGLYKGSGTRLNEVFEVEVIPPLIPLEAQYERAAKAASLNRKRSQNKPETQAKRSARSRKYFLTNNPMHQQSSLLKMRGTIGKVVWWTNGSKRAFKAESPGEGWGRGFQITKS